ncbi:MAG: FtsH protease activity modulator HflK [Planctomycetota bacterium]|jgi:membrane protease subunit HflK
MAQSMNEVEFLLREYYKRYRGRIRVVILVLLILWALGSVFYQVDAESEGVVLRLGKYVRTSQPGLHGKLPWPIETVNIVPIRLIQTLEFGFATLQSGRVTQYARMSPDKATVARMLTGDLNLAHVEWIVQYRIKDAKDYLFHIGGNRDSNLAVGDTIRDVSESVMRKLVGDASVDEVITIGRDQIASDAKVEMQKMLNQYQAGVEIVTVKLQAATPPEEVKDAFDEVNRARQNKERAVNEAMGERNRMVPAARGQRDRTISEAEGYKERVVREMQGRANAFLAQLTEFEKAPEVTETRLYLTAMEEILAQAQTKTVIDESIQGLLPLLNLDTGSVPNAGPAKQNKMKGGAR